MNTTTATTRSTGSSANNRPIRYPSTSTPGRPPPLPGGLHVPRHDPVRCAEAGQALAAELQQVEAAGPHDRRLPVHERLQLGPQLRALRRVGLRGELPEQRVLVRRVPPPRSEER